MDPSPGTPISLTPRALAQAATLPSELFVKQANSPGGQGLAWSVGFAVSFLADCVAACFGPALEGAEFRVRSCLNETFCRFPFSSYVPITEIERRSLLGAKSCFGSSPLLVGGFGAIEATTRGTTVFASNWGHCTQ
jgi:hypothetical protein